jgi:hypothetical protein
MSLLSLVKAMDRTCPEWPVCTLSSGLWPVTRTTENKITIVVRLEIKSRRIMKFFSIKGSSSANSQVGNLQVGKGACPRLSAERANGFLHLLQHQMPMTRAFNARAGACPLPNLRIIRGCLYYRSGFLIEVCNSTGTARLNVNRNFLKLPHT